MNDPSGAHVGGKMKTIAYAVKPGVEGKRENDVSWLCVHVMLFPPASLLAGVERKDPSLASQPPVWLMINCPF